MKLIFSLFVACFQLSNGLRIDAKTRTFQCRVADIFHQTSLHLSSASRQIASVAALGALIAISPLSDISPANAANLEASQLFAKAESAIEANLRDFKGLDQDWSNSKKVIADNANLLSKASSSLSALTAKMTEYDTAVTKMVEDDLLATTGIQAEIAALRESTGSKYAAAETASAIPAKPAVTAQLFLKAQNEASTLAQDVSRELNMRMLILIL
jgi:hypothetical protein